MNGEIKQASSIVISARKALFENTEIDFTPSKHETSVRFIFAPKLLIRKRVEANSVSEWFDICLQRGLKDVKFIISTNGDNKHLLGFVNTSQCAIVCYWKNGNTSCFSPFWEHDREHGGWIILYCEQYTKKLPVFKNLYFTDNTEEFKQTLLDIREFAEKIEQPYFSGVFYKAYKALRDSSNIDNNNIPKQLPDEFKSIYHAVEKANVFGAMGSWNDSPSWYGKTNGLIEEYNEISNRLLMQLRYHLMYVVNECWKRG